MPTLTPLDSTHGFTAGDLDCSGQVAVCPAYQRVYFADGRPYSANIHESGYHKLDFINDRLVGTPSGAFTQGEIVTQNQGGDPEVIAEGVFYETLTDQGTSGDETWNLIYRTTETPFVATTDVIGADSAAVLVPAAPVYPPHWLNWTLPSDKYTPNANFFPDGGSDIMALAFGRIFINSKWHPHQWFASRINDPLDFQLVVDDVASACNSQTAQQAGLVGDQIVAIIPNKDLFVIFGCVNKMYLLRSDPLRNGFFTILTDNTGIFSSTSYCWDDKYNLYFIGNDGIYTISYESLLNSLPATNITKERVPKLLTAMALNRGTDRIAMSYDKDRYGIQVTVSQKDGAWHTALWLDLRTGGIFPEKYAGGLMPASSFYFDARTSAERTCLIGSYDGYVRRWDEDTKSDINDQDASVAIDSYVTIGPVATQGTRGQVKLNELSIRTGIDSDRLSIGLYSAVTAAKLIDGLKAGMAPKAFKTFTLDSLLPSLRQKLLDGAVAVVISNNTVDSSFNIEKIDADISETGRVK